MFTAALFTGIKIRNQPTCPSTDEWLQKMCCMCIMKYYEVFKGKKSYHLGQHRQTWKTLC